MAVVASVLFLGLLMMKVVLAISTVLVFIGMPIAIVLSPVMPWIARVLARAFAVCLAVPLVWAMCFAASGAMFNDGLFLKGSSGFFDALLEPLAAIALLWMMLLLPTRSRRWRCWARARWAAGSCPARSSYAAGSQLRDVARQHMPGWAGGGPPAASDQRWSRRPTRGLARGCGAESVLAASKVAAGGAAAAPVGRRWRGGWRRCRGSTAADGGWPAGTERRTVRRRIGGHGSGWLGRVRSAGNVACVLAAAAGRQPGGDRGARRVAAAELAPRGLRRGDARGVAARAAPAGVGRAGRSSARDALPPSTQAAVGSLVAEHGRACAAAPCLSGAGSGRHSSARRSARSRPPAPEVRAQAFSDGGASMAGFGASSEPTPAGASARPARPRPLLADHRCSPVGPGLRRQRRRRRRRRSAGPGQQRCAAARARARPRISHRWRAAIVNPAPAHLEAKLRFGWDFTVGQIAAMIGGILIGFAWANWLSPIRGIGAAVTGVYVGGLPVAAGFIASQTEFDLWAVLCSAVRWRRAGGRFVAGAGEVDRILRARRHERVDEAEALRMLDSTAVGCAVTGRYTLVALTSR